MKILEHRQLTELSPAKVQFIRIDPEDISATLADILKVYSYKLNLCRTQIG